jgi:hypothetical protein
MGIKSFQVIVYFDDHAVAMIEECEETSYVEDGQISCSDGKQKGLILFGYVPDWWNEFDARTEADCTAHWAGACRGWPVN